LKKILGRSTYEILLEEKDLVGVHCPGQRLRAIDQLVSSGDSSFVRAMQCCTILLIHSTVNHFWWFMH